MGNLSKPTYNTVTYTPNAGFSGPDSFTYRGTDDQGINSTTAIVSITVNTPSLPLSSPTEQPTVNMVTNVSSGTVDQFGIKEIYLTKPGSEQWFMNMNDPNHDNRTDPKTILTKNPGGS
jgi:Big-like domain-containing protein